jgi:hypothetical protein
MAMAKNTEWRRRVERLLGGDIRPDDLSRLLSSLRFQTHGAASVKELGHFLGHPDERNSGLVTDEAKDFFFFLPFHIGEPYQLFLDDVSIDFPKIVTRNLNRISSAIIKAATGLKKIHAAAILETALRKFSPTNGDRCGLRSPLTSQELSVLQCTISNLVAKPAFTADELFRDFVFVLEKNNLILANEKPLLNGLKEPLTLFAVAAMHHTNLALNDGGTADLFARANGRSERPNGRVLQVVAVAPIPAKRTGGSVLISAPMFSTNLEAVDWCVPELLNFPDGGALWHGPIEMTLDLKLAPL